MATIAIGLILEKIASKDKDFRYMATSDLLNELQKDSFKADAEIERKICQIVLQQLEDPSGDISGLAVKCLAPLVRKISEPRIDDIVEGLSTKLFTGKKEQQRDVGSIGLKTVVSEITSGAVAGCVVKRLTPKLVDFLSKDDGSSVEVKTECLDILNDVTSRFGALMVGDHDKIKVCLLPLLGVARPGIRKRATNCLASLTIAMSDPLLAATCEEVVALLTDRAQKAEGKRTYIQAMGAISRAVGPRVGPYLPTVVPVVEEYCRSAGDSDDELREIALQALESFVQRCPKELAPFLPQVLTLALEYLKYDPNYNDEYDGEGGDEDMDEDGDDDEEDDDGSEDEYSDDEDVAWKVRRAAAKCLSALISNRPEMLPALYASACPQLITRLREREESVKIDVYDVFVDLLKQTGATARVNEAAAAGCLPLLRTSLPSLVKAVNSELKGRSLKSKVAAFTLLQELVEVLPNGLKDHIAALCPGVVRALTDKNSTSPLRIEALVFLRLVMASHTPEILQPVIGSLYPAVITSVGDRYYKVTAEALRVCSGMIPVIRPAAGGGAYDYKPAAAAMYTGVLSRLNAQDQDQEVKECAITCMGLMLATLGDELASQLPTCLPMLLDRLRNEITRLAAVKALRTASDSPLALDLSPVAEAAVGELTGFLRKSNRALRRSSLEALESLVRTGRGAAAPGALEAVVTEAAALVTDADLHVASLALRLINSMLTARPECAGTVAGVVLPQALLLVQSPGLQGSALGALESFFSLLVASPVGGAASFEALRDSLMAAGRATTSSANKQAGYSTSQCMARLCVAAGPQQCAATVAALLADVGGGGVTKQLLALLCLGALGRLQDLGAQAQVESLLISAMDAPSEEVKAAASYALGSVAAGSPGTYLPFLLAQIEAQPKRQYLLLHSLKEVIGGQATATGGGISAADSAKVRELLFRYGESEEEGVRNVVAECLGRLVASAPAELVPALEGRLGEKSPHMRATAVTALKYALSEKPNLAAPLDPVVGPSMGRFLGLLSDDDRHVRRAAVQALNSAAHHKPALVLDLLPTLLPQLLEQTVVRPELIRTVDLGPFKHVVDDGLELRKAAYECVDSLLDRCLEGVDVPVLLKHLVSGLGDHYDVKVPCHLILGKMGGRSGAAVMAMLEEILEPVGKTLTAKVKPDAVKQEVDRNEDMFRSALRAVDVVTRIPGAEHSAKLQDFLKNIVNQGPMAARYAAVRVENENSGTGLDAMEIA